MMKGKDTTRTKFIFLWIPASLLVIACLVSISIGLLLKAGLSFNTIDIGRILVSDFTLVWKDKLELQVDTVTLRDRPHVTEQPGDYTIYGKGIRTAHYLRKLFSKVSINEIKAGELTATINFDEDAVKTPSSFSLTSSDLNVHAKLAFVQDTLVVDITEAASKRINSRATGRIRLDPEKEDITGTLLANLGGNLPVTLDFTADKNQISFNGKEAGPITTITQFVELFGLSQNIQPWITDKLSGTRYILKSFGGVLFWHDPKSLLDTLSAEVRVENCEYVFASGLDPIRAKFVDVTFKKSVLAITPIESTFYGKDGEESRVEINFTDPANIVLLAYIKANAQADDDIVALLDYYKIALPFRQTEGKTATDMTLTINLNTNQIDIKATFLISEGIVEYQQRHFSVSNAKITLENSLISIEQMTARFKELFSANISGTIQTGIGRGDLVISLEKFAFKIDDSILTLDESRGKPTINYRVRQNNHSMDVSSSSWKLNATQLDLGPFSTPISIKKLSAVLPPISLSIPPGISTKIAGSFSITDKQADLQCQLLQYNVNGLILQNPGMAISIKYDQGLTFRTEKTSHWSFNTIPAIIYPSEYKYDKNILSVVNTGISYGDLLVNPISGHYNNTTKRGSFLLEKLRIKNKKIGDLFESGSAIAIEVTGSKDGFIIEAQELDFKIRVDEGKNWTATFNNLAAMYPRSKVLQRYLLEGGSLIISSEKDKESYKISANVHSRLPLLIKDNKPTDHLIISSSITSHGFNATVNNDMQIDYADKLTITSEDIGYNIPAILKFVKNLSKSGTSHSINKKFPPVFLEAKNSYLYFAKESRAPADRIHLKYFDGGSSLILEHGPGNIVLETEGSKMSMKGKGLNDIFMNSLVKGTNLKNGTMHMAATGSFDQFSLLIKINDTVISSLGTLNNILAFLNTIPALITFSPPQYHARGLPVSSAIIGIFIKKGVATFESFEVKSPVVAMSGAGSINVPKDQINMDINLTTQAKVNINKIPFLGYVLVGEKKHPSITLHVSGALDDPTVEKSMFKEIVAKPFNVLYQTLALPFHLVEHMIDNVENKPNSKSITDPR